MLNLLEQQQDRHEAARESLDSKTESTVLTTELKASEPEDQLQSSTITRKTEQMITETCKEIQQSTSEGKTEIGIETSKLSETSEQMTTQEKEISEPMEIERNKQLDQENTSSDKVKEEIPQGGKVNGSAGCGCT